MLPASIKTDPKPAYLLSSDEPLLIRDWLDTLRSQLQQQGFEEILSYQVESGFDWDAILQESQSLSLFSTRKAHLIRFNSNKPGTPGSKFIQQVCENPIEDTLFVFIMSKLDRASKNSAWFKKISQLGEVCELKPVYANEFAGWINQRASAKGLQLDFQAAQYLAELTEGNLLATDQELEKLALTSSDKNSISLEQIQASISRSARYNQFLLTDACLEGQPARAVKILQGLQQEGYQPIQIQYALQNMLQHLVQIKTAQSLNRLNDQLWRSLNIWKSKQRLYMQAIGRFSVQQLERFLQSCATLDRINKGQQQAQIAGADWQAMKQLVASLAGVQQINPVV